MLQFFQSTVGRKYLMGVTGLVWMGFIFGHMVGNMLILVSPDAYNAYGHAIVSNKLLLYGTEAAILGALIVHVICAVSLTIKNRSARDSRYAVEPHGEKGAAIGSRYMAVQGSAILAFIILHLVTFKYGTHYDTTVDGVPMRDLHKLVLEVFQSPAYVAWYVVCLVLMFFHVRHGTTSVFQSFGILERKMQKGIRKLSWVYAIVVIGGFLSQPLYVFLLHR